MGPRRTSDDDEKDDEDDDLDADEDEDQDGDENRDGDEDEDIEDEDGDEVADEDGDGEGDDDEDADLCLGSVCRGSSRILRAVYFVNLYMHIYVEDKFPQIGNKHAWATDVALRVQRLCRHAAVAVHNDRKWLPKDAE